MYVVRVPGKYLRSCVRKMRVSEYLRPSGSTDALATESAVLSQFYAASSVCTPSRAALLTGQPNSNYLKGISHETEHILY
jgi:arylsulfatase A-like enzyme